MMMSIFCGMCVIIDKNYPPLPDEAPWCSASISKSLMDYFPVITRTMHMPKWNKRYQRYQTMIISCAGETDLLQLHDVEHAGCNCIIA